MSGKKIEELRKTIDKIDEQLLKKLAGRFEVVKKICEIKKMKAMKIKDNRREKELIKSRARLARELDLDKKFVSKLFNLIINESRKKQLC